MQYESTYASSGIHWKLSPILFLSCLQVNTSFWLLTAFCFDHALLSAIFSFIESMWFGEMQIFLDGCTFLLSLLLCSLLNGEVSTLISQRRFFLLAPMLLTCRSIAYLLKSGDGLSIDTRADHSLLGWAFLDSFIAWNSSIGHLRGFVF